MLGESVVGLALEDLDRAQLSAPLRATLVFLRKVTREHGSITPADVGTLLAAGVTRGQIEQALDVCFAFNVITRLADTFEFEVGPQRAFEIGANMLLSRGYKL